jgi:hypothetical protein
VSKKNRFVVRKDSCDATGENQWAIWYASTNELWAWSTSSTKAKQLCDLLNSTIYEEGDKSTPATAADPVDAPDHYRQGEIECIDAVKAMLGAEGFAYWLRGNIVAYLWRLPHKGEAKKDAGKTRNLAERLVRLLGG